MSENRLFSRTSKASMPDYISDIICRLTTGQGFRTRELYTNMGEVILKLKRSIIINGINRASYKPDFIDRECPIHLGVMPESRRMTDADIRAKAEALIPKVREFIISIIPKAMELYSQVESELRGKLPRMADFVIWGECGIRAMGFPAMSFYNAYMEAKHEETVDVARDTLIISAIQGLMANREEWKGTTKDLLDMLESFVTENQRKSKAFPKDERRLGRALRELLPTLHELGFEVTTLTDGNRTKMIKRIGETYKVNVSNVKNEFEPTKYSFGETDNNEKTDFKKTSNVSEAEAVNYRMESKNDITDINFHELGDKKNVKTNSQSRMDPSNSYVLKKDDEGNLNTSSHDEITDTPIKNDSPHRPLSPDFQGEPSNSSIQSKKPYKSVGVVLKALEDWGFEVLEYDHVLYEQGKWKAKIKGRFDSHTKEKQEFLDVGFELQFKGSPSADFTWLHFRVEPKKEAIEE